jgi:methylmalonyl-CoA/ethylmalonyl-CoA epimerase
MKNMVNKIEHIGIAVRDLEKSNQLFRSLLGIDPYKTEEVKQESVTVSFFRTGDSKIELLQATEENSPIAKFIAKKGEGIHHIAFEVDDILQSMKELKELGFELLSDTPKIGADNKLICFLHPKSTNGVLVELCQEKKII